MSAQPSLIPPFDDEWPLTAEQLASYENDGMVALGPLLSLDETRDIRARLQSFAVDVVPHLPEAVCAKIVKFQPGTKIVRRLYNLRQTDAFFDSLGNSPRFCSVAKQLVSWEPQLFAVEMFYLAPRVGLGAHIHQEAAYFARPERHRSINLWVALDDVGPDSGTMRYWLGSHKAGLLSDSFDALGNRVVRREVADGAAREIRTFVALRGHAAAHTGLTVHESLPNTSENPRMALVVHYRDGIEDLLPDTDDASHA